jgi:hypothetical protein
MEPLDDSVSYEPVDVSTDTDILYHRPFISRFSFFLVLVKYVYISTLRVRHF